MNDWINKEHIDSIEELTEQYQGAQPFNHIQISNFLNDEKFEELVRALSELEFEHKESDLFSLAQTPELATVEDETIQSFLEFMNSKELRDWFETITKIETNPGKLDCFGAIYQDTDYLLCHDDQLEDRKIAWILYCTTLTVEQGGALALYTDNNGPDKKVKAYQPIANSIAFFTVSPTSWHEVEEVTDDAHRVSIGGWLR